MRHPSIIRALAVLALLWASLAAAHHTPGHVAARQDLPAGDGKVFTVPHEDPGIETLPARERAERASVDKFQVFYDFRFTDKLPDSGITFVHNIVDDAGKHYKAAHYDHGNGIVAADVDGDARTDLYFVNQRGSSELWKNEGGGKFRNVTAQAGVGLADRIAVSASFADVDNDGDQDLYVTTVRMGNVLFENDGKGNFKDITRQSGLGYVGHSSGAVFFDYDKDSRLDLFLVNVGKYTTEARGEGGYYVAYEDAFQGHLFPERTEKSVLYRNLGGNRFADVSAQTHLQDGSWSGDATITDFNQDGWPDLYVLNMQGDNHYYENQGGKTFVDKTAQLFPKTPWGAMGVKSFDYDNDGDFDLFVTDMHSDMVQDVIPQDEKIKFIFKGAERFFAEPDNNIFGNAFYRNDGNGGPFSEISVPLGLENYWPWGVSVDDVNADGWDDILITSSMNFPYRYGVNSLMLNNRAEGFLNSEFLLGIEPRRDGKTHKVWFTLDCDAKDKSHRDCQGRKGRITVNSTLGTRSAVIFDLDDDGDLDIVTNELHSEPQVLVSDLAQKRPVRFLKVRLTGKESNRDGLGAVVKVRTGDRILTKGMDGASGYLSHSILPLYFGLGDAAAADRVEVRWPSGKTQVIEGPIASGKTLEIAEDTAK